MFLVLSCILFILSILKVDYVKNHFRYTIKLGGYGLMKFALMGIRTV